MGTIEKIVGTMLGLIALYLVVQNSGGVNEVLKGLSGFTTSTFKVLQGRDA